MIIFPTPPAADPLHIFSPGGPINPAFMRGLLETTLATQPLPAGAPPERRADHRLATMHAIAAFQPADALEAMLAGQMVAANARMMRCFALAAEPEADKAAARRDAAQAASLIRCTQAMRRDFQRQQAARSKDEDQPSERAGYWFRDVSVPEGGHTPGRMAHRVMTRWQGPGRSTRGPAPGHLTRGTPCKADKPRRLARRATQRTGHPDPRYPSPLRGKTPYAVRNRPGRRGTTACRAETPRLPPRPAARTACRPARHLQRPGCGNPAHSLPRGTGPGDEAAAPAGATTASGPPGVAAARRVNPMPSEEHDLPDRMMTGDAVMRFASRRLDPGQSVEAAWAQAEAEAAAEEAEAAR